MQNKLRCGHEEAMKCVYRFILASLWSKESTLHERCTAIQEVIKNAPGVSHVGIMSQSKLSGLVSPTKDAYSRLKTHWHIYIVPSKKHFELHVLTVSLCSVFCKACAVAVAGVKCIHIAVALLPWDEV